MNYPASGIGQNSKYFDSDLLLDGTYQIISVTVHSSTTDAENTDPYTLRAGLLLVPSQSYSGYYETLSTADNKLNGDSPTQYISQAVVLARKSYINKDFVLGLTRVRQVEPRNLIVPAYLKCTIFEDKVLYNNKTTLNITSDQWNKCQRIHLVARSSKIYSPSGEDLRNLIFKRVETFIDPSSI